MLSNKLFKCITFSLIYTEKCVVIFTKTFISTSVSTSVMDGIYICVNLEPLGGIWLWRCCKSDVWYHYRESPVSAAMSCCCVGTEHHCTVCHSISGQLPNAVYSLAGVKFDSSNNPERTHRLIHKRLYNQSRE